MPEKSTAEPVATATDRAPEPAAAPARSASPARLASAVGNATMQRLVSRPGDPHERQADQIAAGALARLESRPGPRTGPRPGLASGPLAGPRHGTRVGPRATSSCGCGEGQSGPRPLDMGLRSSFEAAFGKDLSGVRIHTGGAGARQARQLRANAFTVGNDVAFAPGRFQPGTREGRRLLAHELAHVLQQSGHVGPRVSGVVQRDPDGPEEAAGDEHGLAVRAPEPEGPTEDTPATPPADAYREQFRGVTMVDDAEFMRGEFRRLIAREGIAGADSWLRRLHGVGTVGLPFSAHTRHLGPGMRPRSPLDAQRDMQREQFRRSMTTMYLEVRADAFAFLRTFEERAREVTRGVLSDSEARTEAERIRYGLTREEIVQTRTRRDMEGGRETVQDVTVSHDMDRDTASARGLGGAAADLVAKRQEVTDLSVRRSRLMRTRRIGKDDFESYVPQESQAAYDRLSTQMQEKQGQYDILRSTYETRYPILASYAQDPRGMARIARGPSADVAALLNERIASTFADIEEVRRELRPGGRVKIWKLPEIVALTKSATGAVAGTTLGEMRARAVDDKVAAVHAEERWTNIALAALAIGLALLAAIPTGGSSLVAGVAAVAAIGSFGLSVYTAAESIQRYQFEKALAGTDFDRARAISGEDPSLFWLAVDVLGAALDVGPALRGTRLLLTQSQQAFRALAPAARRALSASGNAADELAELRRLAGEVPGGGPGLANRVAGTVQRLRGARGSVERVAGAAGHEARAVREASQALGREAAGRLPSAPTRLGGHTVKVTPSGRLVRCSTCGILREEYAIELARNPDLARRWFDIDELARRSAAAGDAAGQQRAAQQASQLSDELEAFRRTREVRAYRGLRPGAIDDVFLMDRRLVVDMPFVGRGAASTNSAGWLRDASTYWQELARRHPDAFSPDNMRRIRGDPPLAGPVAPRNDAQFRGVFTQYDVRGLRGQPMIHHHIGGGGQAAAIPAPLHPGSGGVHNVERAAGVWGTDDPIAEVLGRLLQNTGPGP